MIGYKSNRDVLEEFNLRVHGHEAAKKAIINLVNKSKIRYTQRYGSLNTEYHVIEPSKILLMAPSGQGKTHLVETAAKIMDFPLLKVDACSLAPTSSSGGIDSMRLKKMITAKAEALINTRRTYHSQQGVIDQMVVFIDEIDKLAKPSDSSGRWNIHIQENFLTLFDAKDAYAGVSFIFAGAFTGIECPGKSKTLGFIKNEGSEAEERTADWAEEAIKFGLIPELIGRINGVYRLAPLTEEDYKCILANLLLPKKVEELLYYNCTDFRLTPEQVDVLVDKAMKSGQGVRSLTRELNSLVSDIEFYYEEVQSSQLRLEHTISRYTDQGQDI